MEEKKNNLVVVTGLITKIFVDPANDKKVNFTVRVDEQDNDIVEELRTVFEHTAKKWLPAWVKDNTNDITLHTNYGVDVRELRETDTETGIVVSNLNRTHRGAYCKVAIIKKDNAIYPYSIDVLGYDENYTITVDKFAVFDN